MAIQLPVSLPSIEFVLHKDRQVSGVDLDETDSQKNTNNKCPACLSYPLSPVMLAVAHSKCYHVFCKSCLDAAERNEVLTGPRSLHKCPVCRTKYRRDQVIFVDHWSVPLRRLWDLVAIKCPLKCNIALTATSYLEHVNERCNMRVVKCPG